MRTKHESITRLGVFACAVALASAACASVARPDLETDQDSTTTTTTTTTSQASTTTVAPATTSTSSPSTTTTSKPTTTTSAPTTTTQGQAFPPGSELVIVVSITDGDTIDVRFDDGSVDTVRLIGINTPEKGECFADEASTALDSLVTGEIAMTADVSDRDQYGRLLRYLWDADGSMINEAMVAGGFALARDYPPDSLHAAVLSAAQKQASNASLGLWASDACGAAGAGTVKVGHIEYDAPGNDHENLNGEWVELSNPGPGSVDMTGWVLKDESASHRYKFPTGYTLAPGTKVAVFTGCGSNTPSKLYWCYHSAVWNNGGDTAFIVDASGNIVDSKSY